MDPLKKIGCLALALALPLVAGFMLVGVDIINGSLPPQEASDWANVVVGVVLVATPAALYLWFAGEVDRT